jgi:ribosomal subunit interface protein
MQINIETNNYLLPKYLQERIEENIRHTYRNLSRDINKITLRIYHECKPDRSIESCCEIQVQTRVLPSICARKKSKNIFPAIHAAASSAKQKLSKKLSKFNKYKVNEMPWKFYLES